MAKLNKEQIKEVIGSLTPDMLFDAQFSKYKSEPWSTPLEFFESDRFCGMHLYPNQRLMLKLWNLQIDDLTDYENQTLDKWCREFKNDKYKVGVVPDIRERIEVLKKEGYKHFNTYVLVLGRRASKSFLSGSQLALSDAQMLWNGIPNVRFSNDLAEMQDNIVGSSDFWKKDAFDEVQDDSGIDKDTAVYSIFMATTMTQAQETIFKDYYNAVLSCKWLQDYVLRITPFQITYQTINDRLKTLEYLENGVPLERELSSMVSRPVSSNSDSVRGRAVAKFCLASDTQVLMADGSHKAIIDLNVGDKLKAFDEHNHSKIEEAEVLAKTVQKKLAKRIWFKDGSYIDATDEHKFINDKDEWVEVKDLHVGDKLQELYEYDNNEKIGKEIKCDSSLEEWMCHILDLDDSVICYDKVHQGIRYEFNGSSHFYYPDFIITTTSGKRVIEVKCDAYIDEPITQVKAAAAREYYGKQGIPYAIFGYDAIKAYEDSVMNAIGGDADEADSED